MIAQPRHHALGVFPSSLSEIEQRPNLGTVVLDGATLPVVVGPHRRYGLSLLRQIADRFRRHITLGDGKPPIRLETLQYRREAQAAGTALVH